jgi:hypothetical protein
MIKRPLLLFSILLAAVPLAAQGVPPGERVLVPVFMAPAAGAHGSLWHSELWIYNDNDEPAGTGLVPAISAKQTAGPIAGTQPAGSPGAVLNVPPGLASGLHFNLRVRDMSRQSETWGTEIPLVRESEFFAGKLSLVSVPVAERFRQTVRIYQFVPFGEPAGTVRVRYYRIGGGSDLLLQDDTVTLTEAGALGYAQLGPFTFPDTTALRIDIEPLSPLMRVWAFASVTNNETQHVTTIAPQ